MIEVHSCGFLPCFCFEDRRCGIASVAPIRCRARAVTVRSTGKTEIALCAKHNDKHGRTIGPLARVLTGRKPRQFWVPAAQIRGEK